MLDDNQYYTLGAAVPFLAASAAYSLLVLLILSYQVVAQARRLRRPIRSYWLLNAGDLSMGVEAQPNKPSWRGHPRQAGSNLVPFSKLGHFISQSLARRVRPVETIPYAAFQNTFALSAVVLVLVRIITMLSQFQNEDFSTRTLLRDCPPLYTSNPVWVGYPEDQNIDFTPPEVPSSSYSYIVRLTAKKKLSIGIGLYTCPSNTIEYTVMPRLGSNTSAEIPRLWFSDGSAMTQPSQDETVPYLSSGLQPSIGSYEVYSRTSIIRRFIASSALKDAITGSQPSYRDVTFNLPERLSAMPLNSTIEACQAQSYNLNVVACGSIGAPTGLSNRPEITERQLRDQSQDILYKSYCQVIEDYRKSSAFDILGSIGGLVALLQGIHLFLFGRPLFWGLFGAKLLTPFGLFGRFATQSYRQRLWDYYGPGGAPTQFGENSPEYDLASLVRMNRFLLDYIVDMGPALPSGLRSELNPASPIEAYSQVAPEHEGKIHGC
ncbi:hypothetical protein RhiLY_10030 [Ceratobasidium sp. AG-Ba]|nr:hypothetical protein RhiLY_10030 [Ceratobasidium sp. AG-Ba]